MVRYIELGTSTDWELIVPDDDNDLTRVPRALWVGTGGDINMIGADGNDPVVWSNVHDGQELPARPRRILESLTTAENILALY